MSKTGVLLKDGRFGTAERCEEISQGYAFFAYPWYRDAPRIAPRQGCEESATPFQRADSRVVKVFQGYAKNAYPSLISQHRSAVPVAWLKQPTHRDEPMGIGGDTIGERGSFNRSRIKRTPWHQVMF